MYHETCIQPRRLQKSYVRATLPAQPLAPGSERDGSVRYHLLLKGQEAERSRLAKDLHDGLSGTLSCLKQSLHKLKAVMRFSDESRIILERSLNMVDTSICELRRIAHNMMPLALEKFGLNDALNDYCNTINQSNDLKVKYQSFNLDKRLDSSIEIHIYRIVQELLNNTLKHAGASEAIVQVIRTGNRLSITVEDNGRGFDYHTRCDGKGAGLSNVCNRIDCLKGRMHVESEPDKGSSILIELNTASA